MKGTAEVKVAKQVTLTMDGEEFRGLLQLVREATTMGSYMTKEESDRRGNIRRDLENVESRLRQRFSVYTDSEVFVL